MNPIDKVFLAVVLFGAFVLWLKYQFDKAAKAYDKLHQSEEYDPNNIG